MKKIYILFCFLVFNFSLTFSQNATIEILNDQSLSLEDVFNLIKSKTDYQFVYRYDLIKNAPKIEVKKGVIKVKDLLKKGLDAISCTYEFSDDITIILSRKTSTKNRVNNTPSSKYKTIIKARILDKKTKQPIAYANIGFIKKRIGTISNEEGYFNLEYDDAKLSSSEILQISTLGYKTLKISLDQLNIKLSQSAILYLNPEPFALDEVMLTHEKRKEVRIGNSRANKKTIGYWRDGKALGGEIATKINIKKKNTKLLDLKLNIVENRSDSLKIRVNVYDYTNRSPTKKLLTENIFYTIRQKEGELTIDLKPYNIRVDDDVIISIELIEVYGNVIDFSVSGEPYSGVAFKRYVSQDKWKRHELIGMNFSVLTSVVVNNRLEKEAHISTSEFEKPEIIAQSLIAKKDETTTSNNINGKITYLNSPIPNVNITIKKSRKGTKTDADGNYRLKANVGDVLEYSHVSFRTVNIVVEDVTSTLNIEMVEKINQLDEALVTARKEKSKALEYREAKIKTINTAVGEINLLAYGFNSDYSAGKDLPKHCDGVPASGNKTPLECAAEQKFPFMERFKDPSEKKPIWDIDGVIYSRPPPIPVSDVEHMWFLPNAATRYGHKKAIIVQTISGSTSTAKKKQKEAVEKYRNQNYYQNDAKPLSQEQKTDGEINKNNKPPLIIVKEIYGIITTNLMPLENVNIKVLGSPKGTTTDPKGNYKLKVRVGDELQFSYQGMHKVNIIIEDITSQLNIDMVSLANSLDEVIVNAKKDKSQNLERLEKAEKTVVTSRGTLNPKNTTYPIQYVDGEEISPAYQSLTQALQGKMAGIYIWKDQGTGEERIMLKPVLSLNTPQFAIWDVDGQIYEYEPPININDIKSINLLKALSATNKYGSVAAGGVVVVRTKHGTFDATKKQKNKVSNQFTNTNFYANDATVINNNDFGQSQTILNLKEYTNRAFAFNYYKKNIQDQIKDYVTHLNTAKLFAFYFKDSYKAIQILNKMTQKHHNNPEILKSIAYHLETIDAKRDVVKTYEAIFKLRPKYAQSYRDLANAYVENDQFKKAWRLYMSYLSQGRNATDEGIGQIIYNEMEYLYFNRKKQAKIKETFKPKSEDLFDFRNDIRMVFEWNTSEAEFDLEFVSPDKRSYVFNHSVYENQNLITDEKIKGYSSKDFIIDNVGIGEWLVNISYKGNKKTKPTYFKLTTYYHWGKPNQKKEISLYSFKNEREKIQLTKINKQSLLTSK